MGKSPKPKIYLENRAGKKVTVIAGLHTYGTMRLEAIAAELKHNFGAGGTVKNGTIEIQGDNVIKAKQWLVKNRE
jgi:translation initiation factor 1